MDFIPYQFLNRDLLHVHCSGVSSHMSMREPSSMTGWSSHGNGIVSVGDGL